MTTWHQESFFFEYFGFALTNLLHASFTRKTYGWRVETFKRLCYLRNGEGWDRKYNFTF